MGLLHLSVGLALVGHLSAVLASVGNPAVSKTPPMGFNNWARFECALNQSLFTKTADAMVSRGLLAAGYNRVNIDDCWPEHSRAPNGSLVWNSTLFPNGMIWLGDYLHKKGFKFGIYEDAGTSTCGGYPGSKGHEEIDAKTFASWGVDYLKLDGCNVLNSSDSRSPEQQFKALYSKWHTVLSKLAHPLVFSESAPAYFSPDFQSPVDSNNSDWYTVMGWSRQYGELARHSDDIKVYGTDGVWEPGGHWDSIIRNYEFNTLLARYQACGFHNDPDFLIAGYPDLTLDEMKSHFALWSSFSAPLIISAWIPELKDDVIDYLTNKDIIAVDQDALCLQATLVSRDGWFDVLSKNLSNGDRLLTVFNRGDHKNSTSVSLLRAGLDNKTKYTVKDLWTGAKSTVIGSISIKNAAAHSTSIFRISPSGSDAPALSVTPTGLIFNTFSGLCLTATYKSVSFRDCTGGDSQVWQVTSSGPISPLSDLDSCLTADSSSVSLVACGKGMAKQLWQYGVSGNLVATSSKLCLTQQNSGKAIMKKCGHETDEQVHALPSGVDLLEDAY
jgi:alpha-galactosidase